MPLRDAVLVTPRSTDVVKVSARSKAWQSRAQADVVDDVPKTRRRKPVNVLECIRVEKLVVMQRASVQLFQTS